MKKILKILDRIEKVVCGAGFILLVLLVFISAILRFFRVSMSWNIDLAMLLLAWTSFLGADIAWRSGQLIGIDIITRHLPKNLQKVISLFIYGRGHSTQGLVVGMRVQPGAPLPSLTLENSQGEGAYLTFLFSI